MSDSSVSSFSSPKTKRINFKTLKEYEEFLGMCKYIGIGCAGFAGNRDKGQINLDSRYPENYHSPLHRDWCIKFGNDHLKDIDDLLRYTSLNESKYVEYKNTLSLYDSKGNPVLDENGKHIEKILNRREHYNFYKSLMVFKGQKAVSFKDYAEFYDVVDIFVGEILKVGKNNEYFIITGPEILGAKKKDTQKKFDYFYDMIDTLKSLM